LEFEEAEVTAEGKTRFALSEETAGRLGLFAAGVVDFF